MRRRCAPLAAPSPGRVPFGVIRAAALGDTGGDDVMGVCCALKPAVVEHALDAGHASVLYLDPDQLLLAPIDDVLARVRAHALVLSPHLVRPSGAARELLVLESGTYNGGLVGCSDRPETRRFLAFWRDRATRHPELARPGPAGPREPPLRRAAGPPCAAV